MSLPLHRRTFLSNLLALAGGLWCAPRLLSAEDKGTVRTTYTYKTVGDLEIKADVYRADDDIVRPVVLWIHGGALIVGSRIWLDRHIKDAFLEAGYAIVSIDYRLAPETKLPEIIADVEDSYRWLHSQGPRLFHVDASRIAVMGSSAGGYLTLTAGFRAQPRPAVLVSFWGYGDLVGDWYSKPSEFYRKQSLVEEKDALAAVSGPPIADGLAGNAGKQRGSFYLYCRQQGIWPQKVSGFDPVAEVDKFVPYMPARNVTRDYPPTLLIHGHDDTDVPHEQSVIMQQELERAGVAHRFISVKGGGHGLGNIDKKQLDEIYAQVLPFVDRHVRPNNATDAQRRKK